MTFRVIKKEKIRAMRGDRSLADIETAAGGKFTRAALWQWENPDVSVRPNDENLHALLQALGCEYEDISEPYKPATV